MLIAVPLPFSPLFPYTTLFRSLKTENDRQKAAALLHRQREFAASQPLARLIQAEVAPGDDVQTQEDAVNYALATGAGLYHAVGSCAMGPRDDDRSEERRVGKGVVL